MSNVDVVIPCYNYGRFLPQCVGSVLSQDGVDVRALIIDDCSSDDSEAIGRSLAERDKRVEFRRHPVNQGHIATYNEGLLEWSVANYSLLLSADDALAPGALARATALMDRHRDVGMTYGLARVMTDDGSPSGSAGAMVGGCHIISGSEFLEFCCAIGNPVPTPTAIVRTALQRRMGGYRATLPHTGDMEMWMRFAAHGAVGVVRTVQAYCRRHSANMSRQYFSQAVRDYREVIAACEDVLTRWGARFPDSRRWLEVTYQRLGAKALGLASAALDRGDRDGFRECLQFAGAVYPPLRRSRRWWRLQAKSVLGQPVWRGLRLAVATGRRIRGVVREAPPERKRPDGVVGSWPEWSGRAVADKLDDGVATAGLGREPRDVSEYLKAEGDGGCECCH